MDEQKEVKELAGVIYSQTNYDHGMPWCKMLARNLLENGYRKQPSAGVGLDEIREIFSHWHKDNEGDNKPINLFTFTNRELEGLIQELNSKFSPKPPANNEATELLIELAEGDCFCLDDGDPSIAGGSYVRHIECTRCKALCYLQMEGLWKKN